MIRLLHYSLIINEDLTIFYINKKFSEKIDKVSINQDKIENNYTNIFRSLSRILNETKNEELRYLILLFVSPLIGGWEKGH